MQNDSKNKYGRPSRWGDLKLARPRVPLDIVAEIDKIRDQFIDPEDAQKYILECLTRQPQMKRLRLYDCKISATPGMTGFGEDSSYEEREVPLLLLKNADKCFLVRVAGDSMQDAGIQDGAFIVAEKMNPLFERPPNGSIVVAAVEDQMIIKRYRHRHNKYDLISENRNRNYSSISISSDMSDHHSIYIFGVFQRVIPESMIDMALS